MQELEKILEEIKAHRNFASECGNFNVASAFELCVEIIRKHMNDGWISVDKPPKKDYTAVFAVDKHDYYFVAVYDKEHGYRTNDVGADVDNIVAYCLFNPYRPERREEHDRK